MKKRNVLILGLQLLACMPMTLASSELTTGDLDALGTFAKKGRQSISGNEHRREDAHRRLMNDVTTAYDKQQMALQELINEEKNPLEKRKLIKLKIQVNLRRKKALTVTRGQVHFPLEVLEGTLYTN